MRLTFDSFNARHTPEEKVGETFIDNGYFDRLCQSNHTILLGPRGCGKTTLLKMLTVPAGAAWAKKRDEKPPDLGFTAIYIPMDVHFQDQLERAEAAFVDFPELKDRISHAAVTVTAQLASIECFLDRIKCQGLSDPKKESILTTMLIQAWYLPAQVPSLVILRVSLRERMVRLAEFVNRAVARTLTHENLPNWAQLELLTCISFACEAFDAAFALNLRSRWALCFDELELAPRWLLDTLFHSLRSVDPRILFKLGTSPHPNVISPGNASALNDFDPIKLWATSMRKRRQFCERLAMQIIGNSLREGITPSNLLGESSLFGDDEDDISATDARPYERGSEEWQLFVQEARDDQTLREYLQSKGIDPNDPSPPPGALRDTVLRKIKPIVFFRHSFSKFDPSRNKRVRKPRKIRSGFFGIPAILDISDGNPRFLKRIFEEMCASARPTDSGGSQVERNNQSRILSVISLQFINYIRGIPGSQSDTIGSQPVLLFSMLHSIGKFFSTKLLLDPFTADPISGFVVNSDLPDELIRLLTIAAEHAAIIRVDAPEAPYDPDIRGKRFRLSYLLAPLCHLPLKNYNAISIKKCLVSFPPLRSFAIERGKSGNAEERDLFTK